MERPRSISRIVFALVLMAVVFVPSIALASARVVSAVTASDRAMCPAIDGSRIVWPTAHYDAGDNLIYDALHIFDLSTGMDRSLRAVAGDNVSISGDKIVYDSSRGGQEAIYLYDLTTGTERRISSAAAVPYDPVISGDRVFWLDYRFPDDTDIYMYDLTTGVEQGVVTNTAEQGSFDVEGDRLVFTDDSNGDPDLFVRDLGTGSDTALVTNGFEQWGPSVSGDRVVWTEMRDDVGSDWQEDVFSLDLGTGTITRVTADEADQFWPQISGDWVVWTELPPGGFRTCVAYDMRTGSRSTVGGGRLPVISGTRVAWTTQWIDHDYGPIPGDIYFTNLEPKTTYDRVEGPNRYATAAKASALAYPSGADVAIIATGKNWPDALGGSALAGALDGPVLLVEHDYVPTEIANEIARLKPERAVILGSTDAVGSPVETWLRGKLGGNVTRIAGKNRYETADKVAAEVIRLLGTSWDGRFIVTTGRNFPDALAVAPLSNAERWPLVLSGATGLSAATSATVATGRSALILGDESAVPAAVQTKLGARLGTSAVTRLKGPNRYATALAIAQWGGSNAGLGWNGVALATGQNFPDALAGGVLQGKTRRLMLLTPTSSLDPGVASALLGRKASIDDVRFLGSDRAVSTYTRGRVALALE